MSNLHTVSGQ